MGVVLHKKHKLRTVYLTNCKICIKTWFRYKKNNSEGFERGGSDGSSVISYNSIASLSPCHRSVSVGTNILYLKLIFTLQDKLYKIKLYKIPYKINQSNGFTFDFYLWTRIVQNFFFWWFVKLTLTNRKTS